MVPERTLLRVLPSALLKGITVTLLTAAVSTAGLFYFENNILGPALSALNPFAVLIGVAVASGLLLTPYAIRWLSVLKIQNRFKHEIESLRKHEKIDNPTLQDLVPKYLETKSIRNIVSSELQKVLERKHKPKEKLDRLQLLAILLAQSDAKNILYSERYDFDDPIKMIELITKIIHHGQLLMTKEDLQGVCGITREFKRIETSLERTPEKESIIKGKAAPTPGTLSTTSVGTEEYLEKTTSSIKSIMAIVSKYPKPKGQLIRNQLIEKITPLQSDALQGDALHTIKSAIKKGDTGRLQSVIDGLDQVDAEQIKRLSVILPKALASFNDSRERSHNLR